MAVGQGQRSVAFKDLDTAKFGAAHIRAMLVAGSGFFVDSYDNFVIGLIVPMIAWEYYGKSSLPSSLADGWVKAASSWGNMIGQVSFAILGDILGRKKVYGIELMILICGALLCAFAVWPVNGNPDNVLIMLAVWRFILGVGIGGDYPVSAVITSEFASSDRRGQLIAAVFAMQGFGIICAATLAIIMLAAMQSHIVESTVNIGYVWRFLAGFGAVPALAAVYWRLRIPETPRFTVNVLGDQEAAVRNANQFLQGTAHDNNISVPKPNTAKSFSEAFRTHFSQWANLKVLIGCAACWFFLDIGYYGTNLNTPAILSIIGYGTPTSKGNQKIYDDLWNRAVGTAIINMCGTVPGYWFTVFLVEPWGRKPIQYMGFTMLTILFLVLAIWLDDFRAHYTTLFVVLYSFAQFFFNFGPNSTTFIIPAEVFPTAVRSTGHGVSAASGKAGAILAAQCFAEIAKGSFGFKGVLYIFSACCFLGLLFSFWVPETKGLTLEELSGDNNEKDLIEDYQENKTPTAHV
ncbi:phosphate transporter [Aphanomyces cochlioides]|nr:phosphate transporter [Aphanomyces cochlioides]